MKEDVRIGARIVAESLVAVAPPSLPRLPHKNHLRSRVGARHDIVASKFRERGVEFDGKLYFHTHLY